MQIGDIHRHDLWKWLQNDRSRGRHQTVNGSLDAENPSAQPGREAVSGSLLEASPHHAATGQTRAHLLVEARTARPRPRWSRRCHPASDTSVYGGYCARSADSVGERVNPCHRMIVEAEIRGETERTGMLGGPNTGENLV